ncbi:MAG: MMPL family transporter [Acidobacteriota bacterium]
MIDRLTRFLAWLATRHPVTVLLAVLAVSVVMYHNTRYLQLGTDLTDSFGRNEARWRVVTEYLQNFPVGNQLFVIIQSAQTGDEAFEQMETAADRMVNSMRHSGRFKYARCRLTQEELLGFARLYATRFPSYAREETWDGLRERLGETGIRDWIARARAGLVTSFSGLGSDYVVADPLGLSEVLMPRNEDLWSLLAFDMEYGSGNYFFSRDHTALLVTAEPRQPGTDYQFALDVVRWTREQCDALSEDEDSRGAGLRFTVAGAYVFAEQDRRFIERNITVVSLVSILGNLLFCLAVYRRFSVFLMSLAPTTLSLLWTTGVVSLYPGRVNLISLSFIAILMGIGDDHVVHLFNRLAEERRNGSTLESAMQKTIRGVGRSIVFGVITTGTATAALATSDSKWLSEFGLILTIGLGMLGIHVLFTVPSLVHVWWRLAPPRDRDETAFRLLPSAAGSTARLIGAHPGALFGFFAIALAASAYALPRFSIQRPIGLVRGEANPAVAGQRLLAQKFGGSGAPEVLLMEGSQEEVLQRAERLGSALRKFRERGIIASYFSPSEIVPSGKTQDLRSGVLTGVDLERVATELQDALGKNAFQLEYFKDSIDNLQKMASEQPHQVTVEDASRFLPAGFLDASIRSMGGGRYMAAVSVYPSDPEASDALPDETLNALQRSCGPFFVFSFARLNRDVQSQVASDARRSLQLTIAGIVLIVFLCFRSVPISLAVLTPTAFSIIITFGALILLHHPFSLMAVASLPLIIGIGIDNGIHMTNRYLEGGGKDIIAVVRATGAALFLSNLTTLVGFGALMLSDFHPLAELGLVTTTGMALTMSASLLFLPAAILLLERRRAARAKRPA